jgi:hypothetical protein
VPLGPCVALHFSLGVTPPSPSGPPHSLGPLCFAGPAGPAAGLRDRRRSRLCGSLCDSPDPSPSVPPFGRSGKRCSGQPLLGDPRVRLLPLVPGSPRLCPGTDGLRVPLQRLLLAPRVALNSPVQQGAKTPALPFHRLVEDPGGPPRAKMAAPSGACGCPATPGVYTALQACLPDSTMASLASMSGFYPCGGRCVGPSECPKCHRLHTHTHFGESWGIE